MLKSKEGRNAIKRVIMLNPKDNAKDLPLSEYDKLIIIGYELPSDIGEYLKDKEAEAAP